MKVFSQILDQYRTEIKPQREVKISEKQFQSWKRQYIFQALQGESYGESFCQKFGITDFLLSYVKIKDIDLCDKYIHNYYIRKS